MVKFYHKDHLGSTRVVTDAAGVKIAEYKFAPYGEKELSNGDGTEYGFTDKAEDVTTGLQYFGARFYDPEVGRWLTQDPANQGLNWYLYCGNNPLRYRDFDGRVYYDICSPTGVSFTGKGTYSLSTTTSGSIVGTVGISTTGSTNSESSTTISGTLTENGSLVVKVGDDGKVSIIRSLNYYETKITKNALERCQQTIDEGSKKTDGGLFGTGLFANEYISYTFPDGSEGRYYIKSGRYEEYDSNGNLKIKVTQDINVTTYESSNNSFQKDNKGTGDKK